nr:MAG TPA: hypothetical protein [Caudoviricetes sp.]
MKTRFFCSGFVRPVFTPSPNDLHESAPILAS